MAIDLHPGGKCIRCRTCDGFACKLGAKNDAEVRLVDPALATGNVDLILETYVHRFITDATGRKVTGVEVEQKGERKVIGGEVFISSAGAINSAALLLRSANDRHPRGLGNSSDQLGRNYMAHNNTAMMAVNPFRKNNVVFQKSLCINDFYLKNERQALSAGQCAGAGQAAGRHADRQHALGARTPDELVRRAQRRLVDHVGRPARPRTTASPSTATARSASPTRPTTSSPMANWWRTGRS